MQSIISLIGYYYEIQQEISMVFYMLHEPLPTTLQETFEVIEKIEYKTRIIIEKTSKDPGYETIFMSNKNLFCYYANGVAINIDYLVRSLVNFYEYVKQLWQQDGERYKAKKIQYENELLSIINRMKSFSHAVNGQLVKDCTLLF